jgi:preprotein translocase subunit SecG
MYLFVVALHVVLCIFMVLIILLQPAKGEVGLAFGGGGTSSVFGPRGPASILQRATTLVAVLFMATSITLALYSNKAMLANANVDDEFENIARERELEKSPDAPAPVAPAPEAPEIAPSLEAPQ